MLGACRPPLAHGALPAEPSIGLSLPCNVVVRALGSGRTQVEALNPAVMVGVTENDARTGIADEATTRLNAALDTLPRVAFETFRRAVGGSGASPGSRTWRVGCSGPEGGDGGGPRAPTVDVVRPSSRWPIGQIGSRTTRPVPGQVGPCRSERALPVIT